MTKYVLLITIFFTSFNAFAQQDSNSYSAQRVKVNQLLKERSMRFGKYDESLNQRSGIFGWQTKKDIKNSNEILRQVVLTDNNIFKELKVLMDYKDLQNEQKIVVADQSEERTDNYMRSIKKLQDRNVKLKAESSKIEKGKNIYTYIIIFLVLVTGVGFYLFSNKIKSYEKRTV
ncbi:hypothetical protein EZJ43_11975 [Pedobacter changchengzhani]|uniref:Uncharacterized protein n=1 Tax=Pedobacter changchengzhani TaxID=2529274 RepID=A0A4R5MJD6_9SPHI|nr:hypothetical protein [Pedobacter changchengzhani]TDG35734.1 hypothetical protein EZJ43_11975 [Pedobacter changchengzhani]